MAEIRVRDQVWRDFVTIAEKKQRRPEALAEWVLRDFLQRAADEDLINRSAKAARKSPRTRAEIELWIKRRRQD